MKKIVLLTLALIMVIASTAFAEDLAAKMDSIMSQGPKAEYWQIKPEDLSAWIKEGRKDFQVIDVRPSIKLYEGGHIPGSIYIGVQDIFKATNLAKLQKGKKIVLACVTGQTQNLPILPLRAMGYDAYTVKFGYAGWSKDSLGAKLMTEAIGKASFQMQK